MPFSLKSYLMYLLGMTFFVLAAGLLLTEKIFPVIHLPELIPMVFFFALATLLFHLYLLRVIRHNLQRFTLRFMVATGVKMLFYMIMAGLYLLLEPHRAIPFLIAFFLLYLLFTVFEISILVRSMRNNKGK
ncbi:MAG TPA: hypothetical protein ENF21_05455 [Bacteroidetes bacterium]|nr:hypothetical protein [Bacteroidota bacterium]